MAELTSYDIAYMQFKEEVSNNSKKEFDAQIEEHGWDYVVFYERRYHEVMAGYAGDNYYDVY